MHKAFKRTITMRVRVHTNANTEHQNPLGTVWLLSVAHFKASNIKPD